MYAYLYTYIIGVPRARASSNAGGLKEKAMSPCTVEQYFESCFDICGVRLWTRYKNVYLHFRKMSLPDMLDVDYHELQSMAKTRKVIWRRSICSG